ncbi:MAG: pyridoxamine 5'-phosphate oxidase family protein [Cyanobacteria bacterium]|nr:pyridoxamine 5'-phosphate oxidase family protein [Cyanobacteriota bacterium]
MGKFYGEITPTLREFIGRQHLFFTATAPSVGGRVNLSPKGADTLRILGDRQVAYLDLTGSGNETAAHLRENGRLTVMFCSFEGPPQILRLYGTGRVVRSRDRDWSDWLRHFEPLPGARQIIVLAVESVQTSCGMGVPLFEHRGDRPDLQRWAEGKGEAGLQDYWTVKNQVSIDGLPTGLLQDEPS